MHGLIKILGIITLVFIIIVAMDTFGVWRAMFSVGEYGIREIIDEEYPDSDTSVVFTENCTICDSSGCRTYPDPCWKIRIITESGNGTDLTQILMDDSGGKKDSSTEPCTAWWCDADPCRYSYKEQSGDCETTYTNNDCGSSELSCDPQHERCRLCETGQECVATTVTTEPNLVTYIFEVLRTGEYAVIDTSENICRIYSRGDLILSSAMDPESCGSMMFDNTMCYDGVCDFVPEFDLIQE